jgi:hypothetical protein
MIRSRSAIGVSLPHAGNPRGRRGTIPGAARHLEQDTELGLERAVLYRQAWRLLQMYSILYIIGAIVVIIVVLRLLGIA